MPADHDEFTPDPRLERMLAELRRPVQLDPAVDRRAIEAIRKGRPGIGPGWARYGGWIAGAAVAAGLLVTLVGPPRGGPARPGSHPVILTATHGRSVQLRLVAPSSSAVVVVGDFNDWDPVATPLRLTGEAGVWVVELRLPPGRYRYTFLVDGRRWVRDPSEPPAPDSDFGAPMSVITVS